jgi:hypothetical protein
MLTYRRAKSKPQRVSPRPPARFGAGLLPSCPVYEAPASLSDLEWAEMILNIESDWDLDTIIDQQHAESRAIDALCAGMIPDDLATAIERTSLVGHRP